MKNLWLLFKIIICFLKKSKEFYTLFCSIKNLRNQVVQQKNIPGGLYFVHIPKIQVWKFSSAVNSLLLSSKYEHVMSCPLFETMHIHGDFETNVREKKWSKANLTVKQDDLHQYGQE